MYIRRISFLKTTKVQPTELTPSVLAQISPPSVSNPSDNLKNLFEIPVLFYALILYIYVTKQVDTVYVTAAWIFVVFRTLHSAVHCTFNYIMLRLLPLPARHTRGMVHRNPRSLNPLQHINCSVSNQAS